MCRPNPPADITTPAERTWFYNAFYTGHLESLQSEMGVRIRTGLICLALATLVTFGTTLGIWLASTGHLSALNLTLAVTGTVVVGTGGMTLVTLLGIKLDLPAYQISARRDTLNQTVADAIRVARVPPAIVEG